MIRTLSARHEGGLEREGRRRACARRATIRHERRRSGSLRVLHPASPPRHVDDATFNRALALFGERGVVDLIGVSGYYTAVSMTLNVAKVMPEGAPLPLK